MNHTEMLQTIINKRGYKSYLEIGLYDGKNFESIQIDSKEGCDPDTSKCFIAVTYPVTSDEMFACMDVNKKYDIIFIDGMHDEEFVDRDIINSLKHLNPGGVVCLHDVLPYLPSLQTKYETYDGVMAWNGDVWKSIVKLQDMNISFNTIINEDFGLCVINYKENPHALSFPEPTRIRYDYVFNKSGNQFNCLTEQGIYTMHAIPEEDFLTEL